MTFHFNTMGHAGRMSRSIRSQTQRAADRATIASNELAGVSAQIDRLSMICEALWTMLKQTGGYTDEQLGQMIEEIDMRDGKLDGRAQKAVKSCPSCSRTVSPRTNMCIYCGTPAGPDLF